jgi:hypothetical protein
MRPSIWDDGGLSMSCRIPILLVGIFVCETAAAQDAVSFRRHPARGPAPLGVSAQPEPRLAPIVISPDIQYTAGNVAQGIAPVVQGQGEHKFGDADSASGLALQFKVLLKPTPQASTPEEVAQQVKIDAGLAAGGFGLRAAWFPAAVNTSESTGTWGIDSRISLQVAYQRAQTTDEEVADVVRSDFGMINPEVVLGVWLKYLYIGYGVRRFWTFGTADVPDELTADVDQRNLHRVLGIIPLQLSSGESSTILYLEGAYAADQQDFSKGTFVMHVGMGFQPL